ncbi:forkhead-associated domain-containing protein 1 isoform X1 [Anolis carolinensis]|uniref:forkhead-associated domain-containing protein 1 isoform X1 n=1 Tax=Anolis carolinensis TaxID=28377 RepID=UPI002F2B7DB4
MKAFLKSPDSIFALRPKITLIGRHEDADIVLKSVGVEDHHAALEFSEAENSFVLRDFNSAQGTFVNDCQVQNAAVRVSPGDLLRFGASSTAFELALDSAPQVSYPPVSRRLAWPGQLQVVTETKTPPATVTTSQFPVLPSPRSSPVSQNWSYRPSGASPHPPRQKRPLNAWGRPITSPSFSPDAFARPSPIVEGNGFSRGPLTKVHQGDALLKERDDVISKLGSEISRLSAFESECGRKDVLIAELQAEIVALNDRLAAPKAEFQQKLVALEEEVVAKAEEIKALREQINNLQKNTSEVLCHSISERDLQIAHWKSEMETLKKSYSMTTGLVTSLQKDVTVKDQRIQQLKTDTEKLKREIREKDNQLARVSAQCSRIKEEMKRELREREANDYENRISELELHARRSEDDLKKSQTEQETLAKQLAQKSKSEGALREECAYRLQQLQEMARRERLIRSDMDLAATQAQSFRHQITEILFFQLPEESVTEQQIVEKIKHIQAANVEYCQKEIELREEMRAKRSETEQVSANVETLKDALEGVQDFLQTPYCSHSLRTKVSDLQNVHLTPPALDVQAATVQILGELLNWVEATEGLIWDLELDLSTCEKGMSSYMKTLRDHHHNNIARLRTVEEAQEMFLQEKLKKMKDKLQEEFRGKEKDLQEVEKEHQKVLEGMIALEETKWKDAVEEEKKKVKALETQAKQLAEVIEQKAKSESMLHARITETLEDFEAAKRRKTFAEEKLLVCEKRLRGLENEMEAQRRKHLKEISEYKEQVKQHSQTIVHLENKHMKTVQRMEKAREENGTLWQQTGEMRREPCKSFLPEPASPERSHVFLKEELEAAKRRILSDEAVIAGLKKELAEARARVSDAIGELSEKQKVELERKQSLVQSQLREINDLQEELLNTRTLVGQKDADLQVVREELRNIREKMKEATKQRDGQHKAVQTEAPQVEDAVGKGPVLALSDLGLRCKGSRHEETIQRQKEALAELRHLVKALEKACPSDSEERKPEALIVCKKSSAEKTELKTETGQGTGLATTADTKLQSRVDPNVTIERTARLEMADALDLSENMYLDVMRDLANLADVKELAGTRTVMHLPRDEREKLKLLRQKDLRLLCGKIGQMKSRLERKESLLKEYEKDVGKLRANHQTLRACQSEIAKLGDRIYQEKEEKALLKEALERTRLQLIQERRLNRALKQHKVATPKKFPEIPKTIEGREKRVPFKDAA